jgi:hypothetical protein
MTDWNDFRDNVERATWASSQFHEIGEELIKTPDQVDLREFAARMVTLQKELEEILAMIGPGSPIALDEIADAFSRAIYGRPTSFRMTPPGPATSD